MANATFRKVAVSTFAVLAASLLVSCGSSDTPPLAEDGAAPAAAQQAVDDADQQTQASAGVAGPSPTTAPATAPTGAASVPGPTASPKPEAGFSTVEELIAAAKARRGDPNVLCLAGDDTQFSREVELHGRCVELAYQVPRDGIPAIFNPKFTPLDFAEIPDSEPVIGLSIEGEHRAYSVPFLSAHEIVNDVVGGKPVAVTW